MSAPAGATTRPVLMRASSARPPTLRRVLFPEWVFDPDLPNKALLRPASSQKTLPPNPLEPGASAPPRLAEANDAAASDERAKECAMEQRGIQGRGTARMRRRRTAALCLTTSAAPEGILRVFHVTHNFNNFTPPLSRRPMAAKRCVPENTSRPLVLPCFLLVAPTANSERLQIMLKLYKSQATAVHPFWVKVQMSQCVQNKSSIVV
jgi:hypothetical protein